ncbi:FG-GAP-like repeat-containing protein [Streptomyces sp.]|uniref:FG-GAP-like repeat-containing protein n=1 Tax=Streptomyces sp. TaxID=1931 RepID=UPI002D77BD90|nr:FG-GAP-like repeat-containing protein [Streptomyces sp.]HET6358420.1 FG-GAP-like repeat-containing protein [Streptomyces sp.]
MRMRRSSGRAAATAVVLALGGTPVLAIGPVAAAAEVPVAEETVIPADARFAPRAETLTQAGTKGYMHVQEGTNGSVWTDYASGETEPIAPLSSYGVSHSGLRLMFSPGPLSEPRTATIRDLSTKSVKQVEIPAGAVHVGYNADSVTVARLTDGVVTGMSILRSVDGTTEERTVDGVPSGMTRDTSYSWPDTRGTVVHLRASGKTYRYILDYPSATLRKLAPEMAGHALYLGEKYVLGVPAGGSGPLLTVPRDNASATPVATVLPAPAAGEYSTGTFRTVGDHIVFRRNIDSYRAYDLPGYKLQTIPVGGGAVRDLLPYADDQLTVAPDGSAIAVGGTKASDWALHRISVGADGSLAVTRLRDVPPVPAPVEGLALGGGRLSYVGRTDAHTLKSLYERDVAVDGTPTAGERRIRGYVVGAWSGVHSLGNGYTAIANGWGVEAPLATNTAKVVRLGQPASLVDANGRYTVINGPDGTSQKQYIGDFEQYSSDNVVLTRAATAASVWGTTLWKPGTATGTVSWYDLKATKSSADLAIGSGCVPNELQAVGRWLYWSCGPAGKAGVWDQKTRRSTVVPSGEALLGDGFVVRKDIAAGKLMLTDVHAGGGTAATTTEFADVPTGGTQSGRRLNWTVDKLGGHVAYVDAQQRIHIKPVTVPRSPIGVAESQSASGINFELNGEGRRNTWKGTWLLTRPAVHWSLAFRDSAGRVAKTVAGTDRNGAQIAVTWDGTGDNGKMIYSGKYTWTLSADSGDGPGTRTVASGTVAVSGAVTPFRDYSSDGEPELFTKVGGELTSHQEFYAGNFTGASYRSASGWTDSSHVVPFGDMDGDGCNDLLVRTTGGDLYRYGVRCGGVPRTSSPRARIGAGFGQFDSLTSPGDMTGDGRADLVARQRSTGDVYLYADNGKGGLSAPVKIGAKWTGYRAVIGAGDLNGDGVGDVLAVDKANSLWRYEGSPTGFLKPRVLVFGNNWATGRNAFVGVGDLDGDGRNDLVSRDTAGRLLRNSGDGKGSFRGTVQIGTGWQRYTAIY